MGFNRWSCRTPCSISTWGVQCCHRVRALQRSRKVLRVSLLSHHQRFYKKGQQFPPGSTGELRRRRRAAVHHTTQQTAKNKPQGTIVPLNGRNIARPVAVEANVNMGVWPPPELSV